MNHDRWLRLSWVGGRAFGRCARARGAAMLRGMASLRHALLDDAPPARPAAAPPGDRAVSLAFAALVLAEGLLRPVVPQRGWQVAVGLAFASTLWLRASRPLRAVSLAFGVAIAHSLVERATAPSDGLTAHACVLLLPYSLLRWGSAREVTLGLAWIAATYLTSLLTRPAQRVDEVLGGAVVLLFPAAVGATVRLRAEAHRREVEHARWRERAALARELHDTVAHHLAAVTIQAQAARAVLAKRPAAAEAALGAIESEAGKALAEMRQLVGALRDAPWTPPPGLDDLDALTAMTAAPRIVVEREGEVEGVPASVLGAVVRLAREAVTNAVRHAVGATRVTVRVVRDGDALRVTVTDDGAAVGKGVGGFGIQGMAERAALLGGRCDAGPRPNGGWEVRAVIPWTGAGR
jgi:signal transduction histidine kinase